MSYHPNYYEMFLSCTETSVKEFVLFYQEKFPSATITPKMHMMLKHLPPQMRKWNFGMGFLGEQGAESIHASFNSIERVYSGIPNKVDRLLRVMQEHYLRIEPDNVTLKPQIKKEKCQRSRTTKSHTHT